MRIAIIRFPGSNCDQDAYHAVRRDLGADAEYVWHEERSLRGFDAAILPGGFSYGDYLRVGAIASRAPIIEGLREFAAEGKLVLGVCNGFQVLCEAGLLPGALIRNFVPRFVCRPVWLRAENSTSPWTRGVKRLLRLPIAHGEGRYVCDPETLARLEASGRIAFRYVDETGDPAEHANPNGSVASIAGILDERGNVLGMMPHPERATHRLLGGTDGLEILRALVAVRS